MENTLIPMTDFVLKQSKKYFDGHISLDQYQKTTNDYANFLKQPLQIWMFVPVSESGDVLDNPDDLKNDGYYDTNPHDNREWNKEAYKTDLIEYNKAKERVLFEGFSMCDRGGDLCIVHDGSHILWNTIKNENIEHLVKCKLTLTETALKQIHG